MRKSISIFIPMYNEEENVAKIIPKVIETLESVTSDYELLLINDASTDGTLALAENYAAKNKNIRIINLPAHKGYGVALRTGWLEAKKDIVFYIDADVPIEFTQFKMAIPLLDNADVVVGYRIDRKDTPKRWLYSKVYNSLIRFLFHLKVRDINFCFKLFKKEVLNVIAKRLRSGSGFIPGEALIEAQKANFKIVEVPIKYFPRESGKSKLGSFRWALYTFEEICCYWLRIRRWSKDIEKDKNKK